MTRTGGQLEGGNEQFVLSGFAFAYRHAIFITNVKSMSRYNFDFFNGLIAIPHASTHLVSEVVGLIGRSRQGIQFDALDKKPVKLVALFLVPEGQFQKHTATLVNIAKLLHRGDFRNWLNGIE
ncbi:MAG TPA: PTS sugar transporter subunit IIA [Verrucomicrobiae bacterium]|nr:PTS sugar transporter subunit IIA [Verrucomicrobiae bacterium]